jgi:hypothetical protein
LIFSQDVVKPVLAPGIRKIFPKIFDSVPNQLDWGMPGNTGKDNPWVA